MVNRYFAYGSNMSIDQMGHRCPGATVEGIGILVGWRYLVNRWGVATVVPAPGEAVHGVVWEVSATHEQALDAYEGVGGGHYTRELLTVETGDASVDALVYVATSSEPGVARPDYQELVVDAAVAAGLPERHLRELRAWLPT